MILKEIYYAARHSGAITRQLLAFARKQTVVPRLIDLNEVIEGMLNMLHRLLGEDVELVWHAAPGTCEVRMDPTQIDQILVNMCINARDAIHGAGRLTLETQKVTLDPAHGEEHPEGAPDPYVLLSVTDTGCGMDRETLDKIFEPFFTTKDVGKGTGLGLSTVYGIIRQNEGFIKVRSEPGQGSCFRIYLPHYAGSLHKPEAESSGTLPKGEGETILLTEDEKGILTLSAVMLSKLGYQVLTASCAEEALQRVQEHDGCIDLLVTDVVMPGMNGKELADQLTKLHPGLKVLFMSGYTSTVIQGHGILKDGLHLLQKPFSRMDLAIRVRQMLDQPSEMPTD